MKALILGNALLTAGLFVSASAYAAVDATAAQALAQKSACMTCHAMDKKVVGPGYKEVAAKYKGDKTAEAKLIKKVKDGGAGVWGNIPMPPNPQVKEEEIKTIVQWVLSL